PARVAKVQDKYPGGTVPDPYRWLEDPSQPDVKRWILAENRACGRFLAGAGRGAAVDGGVSGAQPGAVRRSLPEARGQALFFSRQDPGQEQAVLVKMDRAGGPETMLLDPNAWSKERHAVLGEWYLSPDGAKLAYSVRQNNADLGELRVRDLASGRELAQDHLAWADWGDLAWAPDSQGFYYTRLPETGRGPDRGLPGRADLALHLLGTPSGHDRSVCPASQDPQVYESPQVSDDGRWLFLVRSHGFSGTDLAVRALGMDGAAPVPLFHQDSATAQVLEDQGRFFLMTDLGAPHGVVLAQSVGRASAVGWKPLLPERSGVFLDSIHLVDHRLVVLCHSHAANQVEIWSLDGQLERSVELPGQGSVEELSGRAGDREGYLSYQSFTQPETLERFTPALGSAEAWQASPAAASAVAQAQVSQVWYPSKDGTRISMFLIQPKGQARDGQAPFVLEGYGGFATPVLPRYWPTTAALLQAGFGVAWPNLRGGGEYGEAWHQAGMLERKQNTFDDLIAAAQYLTGQRYTSAARLAILGSSNGGLLVAAALTQAPQLFGAAVCGSPLTDMLRYPLFGEGPAWVTEYGDPKVESQAKALAAYSPYHHVRPGTAYPPTLILCNENDDRVDPMHARKFAAALQAAQAGPGPILLHTRAHAGHAGAGLESEREDQMAEELGFLETEIGCQAVHAKP
ncbi:MAG TPA: prolyl oligopeptidase family serine peptidase, partial [bacterium]|nr:prolyl oligopeptidase family serine peptidase [bacterium]